MPQLLALEWNASEARLVVASSRAGRVVIQQAFSVSLRSSLPERQDDRVNIGERIAAALAARGVSGANTLVAVGRSNIELRQLSLPPGDDDELPEMVRFQAMQEFNELDENWLLDFVPPGDGASDHRSVLAAAIDPQLADQLQDTCRTAGLKPKRLVLRPCSAASLFSRSGIADGSRLCLLVDLLSDEADLTVMIDDKVVFLRTARLGGDPLRDDDCANVLLGEIRRTMAAAQNQLGGRRVRSIVLCGSDRRHKDLTKLIEEEFSINAELFDPFSDLNIAGELRDSLPETPGRFAPLLGMVLDEAQHRGHAVDFLHPRRRRRSKTRHWKPIAAGVLAAVLAVSLLGWRYHARTQVQAEIDMLSDQLEQLEKEVAKADELKKSVGEIGKWTAGDIVWLDEIDRLCEKFPPAEEAMLTQLTLSPSTSGGQMKLEGRVKSTSTLHKMEQTLGDETHKVRAKGNSQDGGIRPYDWKFYSSLIITPAKAKRKPAAKTNPRTSGSNADSRREQSP